MAGDLDMQARERMAREYAEAHGISDEWVEREVGRVGSASAYTLDHGSVIVAILRGLVLYPTEVEWRVRNLDADGRQIGAWSFGDGGEDANRREVQLGVANGHRLVLQCRTKTVAGEWVDVPPSSGSDGPCSTCGGQGMVCCGRYLDSGECCAAMDGGASMEPCPGFGGSGSEGRDG